MAKNAIESTLYKGHVFNIGILTFSQYCLKVRTVNFPAKIFFN